MTREDRAMLESIMRRVDQIAATIETAAASEDSIRGPVYRLCGDLLTEEAGRMDTFLNPRGNA